MSSEKPSTAMVELPPLPVGLDVYRPASVLGTVVLVVDDEIHLQTQFRNDLKGLGYVPKSAASGAEARQLLGREPVDAIILDLVLDEGEDAGFDLLEWIREHHPGLPVLIMSAARVSSAAIRRAYELGGSSYFVKGNVPLAHLYSDLAARILDSAAGRGGRYRFGDLIFDSTRRTVQLGSREIRLTSQQTALVLHLAQRSRAVTAADLAAAGLFAPGAARSTVHSALLALRRKLDELRAGLGRELLLSTPKGYSLGKIR